jgi:hypothetical protein
MNSEIEEKKRLQKGLENRLKKNEDEKNEILQLYETMKRENDARKRENDELRDLLDREKEILFNDFSRGTSEVKDLVEKEKVDFNKKLEDQKRLSTMLENGLSKQIEEDNAEIRKLKDSVMYMKSVVDKPSNYFVAVREEPYATGGEEYLTFTQCTLNVGGNMDPKSGIFTATIAGCYLFSITVCTQDMKKVLMAIRKNGEEVATVYDQNHNDNHRNSMAGQTLLLELNPGDRVQLYMYTFSGLQDKKANHLTQFVGFLMKPFVTDTVK